MREYKFRAWWSNTMCEVGFIDFEYRECGIKYWGEAANEWIRRMVSFEDIKLMQYTGMTDKNGKEIYEGDIFKWHNNTFLVVFKTPSFLYHKIYDSWLKKNVFERNEESWLSPVDCERYEVIGNKWDNPELLKEGSV